jgi:hypothetical protein
MTLRACPIAVCGAVVAVFFPALLGARKNRSAVVVTLPSNAPNGLRTARLLDGSTVEVLAMKKIGRARRATFRLRGPVVGVVAVDVLARHAIGASGVSAFFRHDTGTTRLAVSLGAPRATTRANPAATASGREGTVVGMSDIFYQQPGGTVDLDARILGPLFRETSPEGVRWVDLTAEVRAARNRELDLQAQGLTDPSTRIRDDPLAPDLRVEGELQSDGEHVTGEIRLVDPTTGEPVARFPIDGTPEDLDEVLNRVIRRLRREILARHPTTTTTSTTSTIASTSTTVTTTTMQGTTTTTPGECTSLSSLYSCFCGGVFGVHPCATNAECPKDSGACLDYFATHPKVSFRIQGRGAFLPTIWWDSPVGLLAEQSPSHTYSLVQCGPPDAAGWGGACPVYFDAGTELTLHTSRYISGMYLPDNQHVYCGIMFTGWSGAVSCNGLGSCQGNSCFCSATVGQQDSEIVATFAPCPGDGDQNLCWTPPGCVPPS